MATTRYAEDTSVPSSKSRDDIENALNRFGASAFGYGWDRATTPPAATIMFEINTPDGRRRVRYRLPMPDRNAREFTHTDTGRVRAVASAEEAYEKAGRARWRALALVIKAKLVAIDTGITTAEKELLADIVVPDGSTVAEWIAPQLAAAYETNTMPALEPPGGSRG